MRLDKMSADEVRAIYNEAKDAYDGFCAEKLSLNMTRGKPCREQLDSVSGILTCLTAEEDFTLASGEDIRNYGGWNGLPQMRAIFSEMMGVPAENIVLGNNSSLQLMFDAVAQGYSHGYSGCEPWGRQGAVKFLCPTPGYDRHFAVTEYFGFELIPVPMLSTGPDMDEIERLIADETVKGCWCVPKYSNPTGVTYSDETVRRFAALRPTAKDFRIFWDNAYTVHDLTDTPEPLLNLYEECLRNGTEDQVFFFASTSKISFPGAGVAAVGASDENLKAIRHRMSFQTIGPDKVNQLRHVKYFKDIDGIRAAMARHRQILAPKFERVEMLFAQQLGGLGIAAWNEPKGGYFINLDVREGCAARVVSLCKTAGLVLTAAGSAYPYGKDAKDTNIRIAPTMPPMEELDKSVRILCTAIRMAAAEKILGRV